MTGIELIGFVASACIIVSLMMRSMVSLRLIGLAGAVTFVAYGMLLGAWPVVATNAASTTIQLFHLRRLAGLRSGGGDPDRPVGASAAGAAPSAGEGVDPAWPPPVLPMRPVANPAWQPPVTSAPGSIDPDWPPPAGRPSPRASAVATTAEIPLRRGGNQ